MFAKSLRTFGSGILRYRAHILVDIAVASMVLSLPLSLRTEQRAANAQEPTQVAAMATDVEAVRASTVSRGGTITPGGNPATRVADDVKPIVRYTLGRTDTLQTLANFYGVSAEAIAVSNGISDPSLKNQQGREIMIPPGEGVLYTVADGDTVESVATRYKVEPKAIMDYNRLYFEPEHFAPKQLIFVPGAALPTLVYQNDDEEPTVIARPPAANNPRPNGRLAWPVGGYISQYFWAFHTGVDLAAPYGTGIGASEAGTVVATGWVAVGGLSVRIKHADGLESGYYHMGAVYVAPGQKVERGQIIGTVGMTGVTTGPHVHWEVKRNGAFVNPLSY
jgi:murein DD-endopeptidase MepM/ murein hydrolase activator NlpD